MKLIVAGGGAGGRILLGEGRGKPRPYKSAKRFQA